MRTLAIAVLICGLAVGCSSSEPAAAEAPEGTESTTGGEALPPAPEGTEAPTGTEAAPPEAAPTEAPAEGTPAP
jgi:hypothetical protein